MIHMDKKQKIYIYYIWIVGVPKKKILSDKENKHTKIKFKKLP